MQGRRFHNLLAIVLTLSGLSLGAYAYDKLSTPPERVAPPAVVTPPLTATRVVDASTKATPLPPLQSFSEITTRPLFSATRRPPVPRKVQRPKPIIASAPTPSKIETGQYTVMGIIIDEKTKAALMRKGRKGALMRVRIGQKLDGWTVEDIVAESVKLRQGEVVDLVLLRDNVLSRAEMRRLKRFKRRADRRKKAARNNLQRRNAGQRLFNPKRLKRPKRAIAPGRPVIGGRAVPRRRLTVPPRIKVK